LFNMALYSRH